VKTWKIFSIIGASMIVMVAVTIYYFIDIKEYDTQDAAVEKIVDEKFEIELPEDEDSGQEIVAEGEDSESEEPNKEGLTASAETKTETSTSGSSEAVTTKPSTPVKPSAASIIEKYRPSFNSLESQATVKLDNLLAYAFSEYKGKKTDGEEISYFYFYNKYNSAAKKLEGSTDSSFYVIYNALVSELEQHGYSAKEAQSIKDHYEGLKKERRNAIVNKAKAQLGV
jgi:hypothetical protein